MGFYNYCVGVKNRLCIVLLLLLLVGTIVQYGQLITFILAVGLGISIPLTKIRNIIKRKIRFSNGLSTVSKSKL